MTTLVWTFADQPELACCTIGGKVRIYPFPGLILAPMWMRERVLYKALKEAWSIDERLALYPMPLRKHKYRRRWWFLTWRESVITRYEPQGGWEFT